MADHMPIGPFVPNPPQLLRGDSFGAYSSSSSSPGLSQSSASNHPEAALNEDVYQERPEMHMMLSKLNIMENLWDQDTRWSALEANLKLDDKREDPQSTDPLDEIDAIMEQLAKSGHVQDQMQYLEGNNVTFLPFGNILGHLFNDEMMVVDDEKAVPAVELKEVGHAPAGEQEEAQAPNDASMDHHLLWLHAVLVVSAALVVASPAPVARQGDDVPPPEVAVEGAADLRIPVAGSMDAPVEDQEDEAQGDEPIEDCVPLPVPEMDIDMDWEDAQYPPAPNHEDAAAQAALMAAALAAPLVDHPRFDDVDFPMELPPAAPVPTVQAEAVAQDPEVLTEPVAEARAEDADLPVPVVSAGPAAPMLIVPVKAQDPPVLAEPIAQASSEDAVTTPRVAPAPVLLAGPAVLVPAALTPLPAADLFPSQTPIALAPTPAFTPAPVPAPDPIAAPAPLPVADLAPAQIPVLDPSLSLTPAPVPAQDPIAAPEPLPAKIPAPITNKKNALEEKDLLIIFESMLKDPRKRKLIRVEPLHNWSVRVNCVSLGYLPKWFRTNDDRLIATDSSMAPVPDAIPPAPATIPMDLLAITPDIAPIPLASVVISPAPAAVAQAPIVPAVKTRVPKVAPKKTSRARRAPKHRQTQDEIRKELQRKKREEAAKTAFQSEKRADRLAKRNAMKN